MGQVKQTFTWNHWILEDHLCFSSEVVIDFPGPRRSLTPTTLSACLEAAPLESCTRHEWDGWNG